MGSGDLGVSETKDSDGVGRDGDPTEVGTRGSGLSAQFPLESLRVFIAGLLQHESRQQEDRQRGTGRFPYSRLSNQTSRVRNAEA